MDFYAQPDMYAPSVDDAGAFIDYTPSFTELPYGIYCPCGASKDKVYTSRDMFVSHTKRKRHREWLEHLNNNRHNLFAENVQHKAMLKHQHEFIEFLLAENQRKDATIKILIAQLTGEPKAAHLIPDISHMM